MGVVLGRAAGGPEEGVVAVALGLPGDVGGEPRDRVDAIPTRSHHGFPAGCGRLQHGGDSGPVERPPRSGADHEEFVAAGGGLALPERRRKQDVAAGASEVEVQAGEGAVALVGAGVVQVKSAGGGAHGADPSVEETSGLGLVVGGVAAAVGSQVDVEDVERAGAGGGGDVGFGSPPPPPGDDLGVGGRVMEPVGGERGLPAGDAREDRDPGVRVGQGTVAEGGR